MTYGSGPVGVFFLSMYEHLFVNLLNMALNLTVQVDGTYTLHSVNIKATAFLSSDTLQFYITCWTQDYKVFYFSARMDRSYGGTISQVRTIL
jgi:hypothetical protein